jgi:two-component system, chemotaxis family, protein-glutamate methylesterase/glutaminase
MKKILLVDDSLVYRSAVKNALIKHCSDCEVYIAKDGQEAFDLFNQGPNVFDLIVLDIEMPVLDGVETTRLIREKDKKIPLIVFAAPTQVGAKKAMDALSLGANEFVKKFDLNSKESDLIQVELIPKILSFLNKKSTHVRPQAIDKRRNDLSSLNEKLKKCELICIGSSTGGPDALRKIFQQLKSELKVPMLIVQHMPPVFTKQFSAMLAKISGLDVCEAEEEMKIEKSKVYLAPGNYHMTSKQGKISLHQGDKVCYVRPSFDVLIRSLQNQRAPICYIVLTGMGDDGAEALLACKKPGDVVLIQDKESSVVWGMPGAIDSKKLQDCDLTLDEIASLINIFKT